MSAYLRDVLHNLSVEVAMTPEQQAYAKGVLVGVVSAWMHMTDMPFDDSAKYLRRYLPADISTECIPVPWRKAFLE